MEGNKTQKLNLGEDTSQNYIFDDIKKQKTTNQTIKDLNKNEKEIIIDKTRFNV